MNPTCFRCQGLLVPELIRDDLVEYTGWRCCCCGEITDPVIERNRLQGAAVTRRRARPRHPVGTPV